MIWTNSTDTLLPVRPWRHSLPAGILEGIAIHMITELPYTTTIHYCCYRYRYASDLPILMPWYVRIHYIDTCLVAVLITNFFISGTILWYYSLGYMFIYAIFDDTIYSSDLTLLFVDDIPVAMEVNCWWERCRYTITWWWTTLHVEHFAIACHLFAFHYDAVTLRVDCYLLMPDILPMPSMPFMLMPATLPMTTACNTDI